jgi:hypothetical protein
VRALTFGAYLTRQWLPGKKLTLAASTYRGYVHKTERHILPALGTTRLRGLRPHHLEILYDRMLHPSDGRRALAPKSVYEVHLIAVVVGRHFGRVQRTGAAPHLRSRSSASWDGDLGSAA